MFDLLARNWWVLVVRGVMAILFGVLAFIWPGITLTVLVLLFGAYALVDGIFAVVLAIGGWQERDDRWLLLLEGILGVGIGIMTALAPELTGVGLLLYIAAWSLATGSSGSPRRSDSGDTSRESGGWRSAARLPSCSA
jgi:uncharacterized membrane protein HdeD (DUF308 family)